MAENMINLYCDESNHLLHNKNKTMTLGYISCPKDKTLEMNKCIRDLKQKHGLSRTCEIKWTKISQSKLAFYDDLLHLFFDTPNSFLNFRCVIADKSKLDYPRFNLTHDDWYYRMYYLLLSKRLSEKKIYNIFLDIKDTCSSKKIKKLHEVLNNSYYKYATEMFQNIQHVHSHEIELLQLADIFIGAIGYVNFGYTTSPAKMELIKIIKDYSKSDLQTTSPLFFEKFNLFVWEPQQ